MRRSHHCSTKLKKIVKNILRFFYLSVKEQKKLINDKKLNLFSNDNTCDHQISQNFDIGTQILDKARNRVNTFANFAKTLKTEQEQIVCLNAQKALLMKLKEITDNFNQQKKSYEQAKKPIQSSFANVESLDEDPEDETIQSQALIAHNRTEDINKLSQTFTDLASIFQQMHQLVMEQGTIIDRIDYNLESAQNYIHKGTDTLKKNHTQMKSRCADNVIKMLVSLIIIFSVLLVLKYARY